MVRWWFEVADDKGKEKKGSVIRCRLLTHTRERRCPGMRWGREGGRGRQLYSFPPKIPPLDPQSQEEGGDASGCREQLPRGGGGVRGMTRVCLFTLSRQEVEG